MKNAFYFIVKNQVRYFNFCLSFFVLEGKWVVKKSKTKFEIFDVTTWETSNGNTHIFQYLQR